jgi:serine/threonine protein kinase
MNADGWERLKQVFQEALQQPPAARASFLDTACGDDASLRREVESLLGAHEGAGPFLETPSQAMTEEALADPLLGRRIGSYRVLAEIGRGGMGAVYRAVRDDDVFHKEVAVKVLQSGLGSDSHRERFRQERQILASLDHPHIARLLDGGATADGRPYLVMELVVGDPIDAHCRRSGMPVRQRLELFRLVCGAVHYAHQNLVVHRDIKPGNVLVTGEGAPKLLDFGIAKLLPQPGEDATVTQFQALTPLYASPEQLRGDTITTASDVYSLGVLLYELLTGRRPFELEGQRPDELVQAISEREPQRPSDAAAWATSLATTADDWSGTRNRVGGATTRPQSSREPGSRLARELRGDLDLIVMKALRKEPARRYGSPLELDEDLRRYLQGLPIGARPETLSYRAHKFVSRHRAGVGAAALLLAILAAGVVATLVQWRRAETQRARAERRFADLRQLANALIFELHDEVKDLAGATRAREAIVRRALQYLDRLAQDSGGDPGLQRELAVAYERVGDVLGVPGQGNLGDTPRALESHRKALAIREALGPGDPADRRALAASLLKVGDLLGATGRSQAALASYRRALELLESAPPGEVGIELDRAAALGRLGRALLASGDTPASIDALQRSVALYEAARLRTPGDPSVVHDLVYATSGLASGLLGSARPAEAVALLRRVLPLAEEASARDRENRRAWRDVGIVWERLGTALRDAGDLDGALELFRRCVEMDEEAVKEDPANVEARRDLSISVEKVGRLRLMMGDVAGALPPLGRCLEIRQALLAADSTNQQRQTDVSAAHYWVSQALLARKDTAGALKHMEESLELDEAVARADAGNADAQDTVAETLVGMAAALTLSGKAESALGRLERARTIRKELLLRDPSNADRAQMLAAVHAGEGDAWAARAEGAASAAHWREARAAYQRSRVMLEELKARGALPAGAAASLEDLQRRLARCEAALSSS